MGSDRDTELGGGGKSFPTTSWSILKQLRSDSSFRDAPALERLINLYWKPVYCIMRYSWGKSNDDAKDLTQEFFVQVVMQTDFLKRFAPERGSFRTFVKAAVRNFMRDHTKMEGRLKRGGDARVLPLRMTDFDLSGIIPDPQSLTPDQVFDLAWKHVVLSKAASLLEERMKAEGKTTQFELFRRYELNRTDPNMSYDELSEAVGLPKPTVKKYLERTRQAFRRILVSVVYDYVDSEDDLTAEILELFGG